MQYRIISSSESNKSLILLFAGWAMDSAPFEGLRRDGYDIAVLWDYRDLSIDWSFTARYGEICILAWSMGVYAASMSTHGIDCRVTKRVAVNGTLTPVDDRLGIPERIFRGTAAGLSEASLRKFYRRMAADRATFEKFAAHMPARAVDELADELAAIFPPPLIGNPPAGQWDLAIVGRQDAIFPAVNQWRAWTEAGVPVRILENDGHLTDMQRIIDRHFVDKQMAAERFGRGRSSYDSAAPVQSEIVGRLLRAMKASGADSAARKAGSRVLEIGSGTGSLSRHLAAMLDGGLLEMWDIAGNAPEAIAYGAGSSVRFSRCDAETAVATLPPASFDLIASASTIQWFNSPARFLRRALRALRPGGIMAFTAFTEGNLAEVQAVTGRSLPMLTAAQWRGILPDGFELLHIEAYASDMAFDSALDVFRHLKATGVNALGRGGDGDAAADLRRRIASYAPELDGRYHISYRPIIIILKKKS